MKCEGRRSKREPKKQLMKDDAFSPLVLSIRTETSGGLSGVSKTRGRLVEESFAPSWDDDRAICSSSTASVRIRQVAGTGTLLVASVDPTWSRRRCGHVIHQDHMRGRARVYRMIACFELVVSSRNSWDDLRGEFAQGVVLDVRSPAASQACWLTTSKIVSTCQSGRYGCIRLRGSNPATGTIEYPQPEPCEAELDYNWSSWSIATWLN